MLGAFRQIPASLGKALRVLPSTVKPSPSIRLSSPFLRDTCRATIAGRQFHQASRWLQQVQAAKEDQEEALDLGFNAEEARSDGPITRFQQLADQGLVDKGIIRTITEQLKFDTMTEVQSMTIKETLKGIDVLAQAKTGTGKTLAFLLPVIQNLLKNATVNPGGRRTGRNGAKDIRALIISPTRELAEQIAVEARKLVQGSGIAVATAVGGTGKAFALRDMRYYGCDLLIGTPGRLQDILSDPDSGVMAPNLHTLVLDEADRLLDQGFSEAIMEISHLLPDRRKVDRQTLLYSATVPDEVMDIVRQTMKPNYQFIRTVKKGEVPTHARVPQKIVKVTGMENLMPTLVELCKREIAASQPDSPFKAIVYFNSTANVALAASVFRNLQNFTATKFDQNDLSFVKLIDIHGKLTQMQRTKASDGFRRARSAILFSSDVTARGMDFPGVTHIIQLATPTSREQYIHRIGRTARGSSTGQGWIIVNDFEYRDCARLLRDLPIQIDDSLATASVDMTTDATLLPEVAQTLTQVSEAVRLVDNETKIAAFMANIGTYNWYNDKQTLMDNMYAWTRYGWGWANPPKIGSVMASKLGLSRVRGLAVGMEERRERREGLGFERGSGYGSRGADRGSAFSDFNRGGYADRGSPSRGFGDRGRGGSRGGFSGRGRDSENSEGGFGRASRGFASDGGAPSRSSFGSSRPSQGLFSGSRGDNRGFGVFGKRRTPPEDRW